VKLRDAATSKGRGPRRAGDLRLADGDHVVVTGSRAAWTVKAPRNYEVLRTKLKWGEAQPAAGG
jgi:hypothetical protein